MNAPREGRSASVAPHAPQAAPQLQYVHLEKLYGYLPGLAESLPAIFGVSLEEYAAIRERFDALARSAAEGLLADREFVDRVARLPFLRGARILAVGDSLTDDLSSWAEILRHVLAIADAIRAFDEPVVDLVDVFGIPAHPELQGPDGVHPPSPASSGSPRHSSRRFTERPLVRPRTGCRGRETS
ncbi:MAG: hypothetical protein QM611_08750 [Microbacterium sp.]|uniref:hypothetical protein n=1 Tax=Microbacterium sp. TaxID=51671 RepID=UPI0039E41A3E